MTASPPCPRPEDLQRFLLGHLSDAEAEPLEQHLGRCPLCVRTAQTLHPQDTLADTVSAVGRAGDVPPDEADPALLASLCRLGPSAAGGGDEMTAAETPSAQLSADTPPPPGPRRRSETTQDLYDFLAPPQGPGEVGRLGGYRVLKVLGQGGMGVVFLAEDPHLQRPVALKAMRPALAADPAARERFLREARATAAVRDDHVITIHQVGEDRGVAFLAMEFLEGLPLDRWLQGGRKPSLAQVLRIGREIALGLAAAHARGLVHRDIKPANLWLEASHGGRVKILDFGLARAVSDDVHLTQSGAVVGTPAYMAPEQARGDKVDHRCDLFSLGCVLYRLCAGRNPFRGETTLAVLTALAVDNPPPVHEVNPAIPPALSDLVMGLLSKDPARRPASARAVAEALHGIERSLPGRGPASAVAVPAAPAPTALLTAPVAIPVHPVAVPVRRRRRLWVAVAAGLLAAAALVAGIVVIVRDEHGREVGRVTVPPGGSAEIKDEAKERPAPKEGVHIEPEPLAPLAAGEALSAMALVLHPARLPGVRSWSIATRESFSPSTVAYAPDGTRLAVGSWDGSIRVWEPQTGRLVQLFIWDAPFSLAWSPDGRVLADGSGMSTHPVQLWDVQTGRPLRALQTPVADIITALAWSPDGARVLGWGQQHSCFVWDAARGKLLHQFPAAGASVAFSPDGTRLAGVGAGNHVLIWDTETGKEMSRLTAPTPVGRLAWSPDGKRLAATGQDGLRAWDVQTGKETFQRQEAVDLRNPPAWSPDGRTLSYSLDANRGDALVEVAPGAQPRVLEDGDAIVAWAPDGKTVARTNGRPYIRLYDAATGKRLRSLTEGRTINGFAWSPDGQTLAVGEVGGPYLVAADTGRALEELKDAAWPLAWSPDGKRLACARPENAILLRGPGGKPELTLTGHQADVTSLAWSPDSKRLASTATGEKRVLLWDAATGQRDRELGPFAGAAERVQWSADGRVVAFNVAGVGWHAWDVEQGRLVNDPRQWKVLSFTLAPDGRSALVSPARGEVFRLRDLATDKEGALLPQVLAEELAPPTWSPDGRLLAVTFYVGIELRRPDLRERLRALEGALPANPIAFARENYLVAALSGERLSVWDADTGRLRGLLVLGTRYNGLAIAPDGHYTGNPRVERGIVMVVQKDDGTQDVLEPAEFEQKYGFKNDPGRVRLIGD